MEGEEKKIETVPSIGNWVFSWIDTLRSQQTRIGKTRLVSCCSPSDSLCPHPNVLSLPSMQSRGRRRYITRPSRRCCSPAPSRGRLISPPQRILMGTHRKFKINIKFQSPSIVKLLEPPYRNYFGFSHRVFQWFSSHFFWKVFGELYIISHLLIFPIGFLRSYKIDYKSFNWLQDHKKELIDQGGVLWNKQLH